MKEPIWAFAYCFLQARNTEKNPRNLLSLTLAHSYPRHISTSWADLSHAVAQSVWLIVSASSQLTLHINIYAQSEKRETWGKASIAPVSQGHRVPAHPQASRYLQNCLLKAKTQQKRHLRKAMTLTPVLKNPPHIRRGRRMQRCGRGCVCNEDKSETT